MLSVRSLAGSALTLAVAAGLSACGSDGNGEAEESAGPSPADSSSAPATYLEVPADVTLTEPGTSLDLGEEGVVAFERRQDEIGVLAVTVDTIERTSFQESFQGWNVDDVTAARTPYFVRLSVTNVGDTDLGGSRLDNVLWADDGENLEAPNYYTAEQLPACSGGPLPAIFVEGATAELCQVYFIAPAHTFDAVAFRPFGGLAAVTWSGELTAVPKPTKPARPGKPDKKGPKATPTPSGTPSGTPTGTPSSSPSAS